MDTVLSGNIWKQITPKVKREKRKSAAIAYVSTDKYIQFKRGDTLICDASDQAIRSGETSAAVLRKFFKAGAQLYSYPNLHAKVLVFGRNALIGSTNLSESSASSLCELALLSSRSSIRSQVAAFIHMTKEEAELIDKAALDHISRIKVRRRKAFSRKGRKRSLVLGNRTWIIRTYQIEPEKYQDEEQWVEQARKEVKKRLSDPDSEIIWIRWGGKGRFRDLAKEGDTIIDMNSTRRGKQITVSAPTPILKRQDRGQWVRFYYECPIERNQLSWTRFARELDKVGITNVKKSSTRELNRRDASLVDTIWET